MKIAFIGTHGTGKTTLCYQLTAELKKQGYNASMITELARKCPFQINKNHDEKTPLWIMTSQISEELHQGYKHEIIICDRCIADPLAYAIDAEINNKLIEKMFEEWIKTYDILFKVQIDKQLIDDGVRAMDIKYQKDIDEQLNKLLIKSNTKVIVLPKKNQIKFIKKILAEKAIYIPEINEF